MANNKSVKLPGFGLERAHALNSRSPFPHPLPVHKTTLNGYMVNGVTLREKRMLNFVDSITDKLDWQQKVYDDKIVDKWWDEAKNTPNVADGDVFLSKAMFDYCIAELREKSTRFALVGFVDVFDSEVTVVKSDTVVPDDVLGDLKACVSRLENVPEKDKDWHPRSDHKVLDLVHPSLFPVIFGRTRAMPQGTIPLEDCFSYIGKGDRTTNIDSGTFGLDGYQWLPADVQFSASGSPLIASYINNLHPVEHRGLYKVLEKFVDLAIPLWEECFTWTQKVPLDRRRIVITHTNDEEDFQLTEAYRVPRENGDGFHGDGEGDADSTGSVDSTYKDEDDYIEWAEQHRVLTFPEPHNFVPWSEDEYRNHHVDFRKTYPEGLQVIFKLANIHLTPEKPTYDGGSWHVEGTLSERIVATAIYYYDEENLTPSRLSFRQFIDDEELMMVPEQGLYESLEKYFGIEQDGPTDQVLGSVLTRPGRMLAFPNVLQHQVGKFELRDKTKPGHRKILAMFLVDPTRRVLSSANVPPQQKHWWEPGVRDVPYFQRLPLEMFDQIMRNVNDTPMSWEESLETREDLMDKRGRLTDSHNKDLRQHAAFSFCEH